MKIAWLSSWPPRPCGIATYSLELVEALRKLGNEVHVVCHTDGGQWGEKNVYPVIDTEQVGWDEKVHSVVKEIRPEVLHIQHEYGLYQTCGDHATGLLRPLFRWKAEEGFPLVMTYHSVYARLNRVHACYMDLAQKLLDAGVVHELYQWANLPANIERVLDNVYVIPHGTRADLTVNKEDAKISLGLEGKRVVGMLGWFTPTKGFHRVLGMWDVLSDELGQNTVLVLAGEARTGDPPQKEYKQRLLSLVEGCRQRNRIKVVLGSFSPEDYNRVLASFDVMVMPYTFASQSGNLAHSLALKVPLIASGMEGLKAEIEASGAGIAVPPESDQQLRRAIVTLIKDDSLRKEYSERAADYVRERIGWPVVAAKHARLYQRLLSRRKAEETDMRSEALLEQ